MSRMPTSADRLDPIAPETTKRMRATAQRDNSSERRLRTAVHALGLRFRLHQKLSPGNRRTADIVLPTSRIVVFVDSCFWHGCPIHGSAPKNNAALWKTKLDANHARDRDTDARLRTLGWKVVRVWEHEDANRAAGKIARVVRARCQRLKTRP